MRFPTKTFLVFLFLVCPTILLSQFLNSRNFTTADGLANNAIRALFLDNKNNLWIGTENGVSFFEGGNFQNIYKEDGLAHNSCWDICQDSNGNMWFASYGGGITKFDGKNFKTFTVEGGLPANKTRKVFSHKNKIYVGTEYGISIIDIASEKVDTPKEVFPHFGVFIVTEIFEYHNQVYFSALNEGIFKIESTSQGAKVVPVELYKNIYSVGIFGDEVFSSNKGFIDVLNLKSQGEIKSATFGESIFWQYAKDKRNRVYGSAWGIFDTTGGLFEIKNNQVKKISSFYGIDSHNLLNVVNDSINDILVVGSKDKGFYQVNLDATVDYNLFLSKKVIDFEDDLVLHKDGLDFKLDLVSKKISSSQFKEFQKSYVSQNRQNLPNHSEGFFELNYDLQAKDIQFYEIVKHSKSYFVSSNIGIFEVNTQGRLVSYIPIHTYKFGFTVDGKFFETNPYGGTHLYDDIYTLKVNKFSKVPTDVVKTFNLNEKTYFLSVFKGLLSYDGNKFKSYLAEKIWKEEKLKFITKNQKGNLVISSEFGDVFIIDDSKEFKILDKISKSKIVGNSINVLESYKNFIFIGTEKGLNIYKDGKFRLIDSEQGLKDNVFTTSEIKNDCLFLGTNKGYYKLDLTKLLSNQKTVSDLKINSIAVNNIPISDDFKWFRYGAKELITRFDKNSFSINFVPKGVVYPNKLKYRYRLKSTNRWSPYTDKSNVFLPYLPHGNYNLEIEVLDLNAGKSIIFKVLKINVKAPFWLTWWFVLVSVFLIFGLAFYVVIRTKRKLREKAIIQKRIAETKLEALLSQMNPHFTFNAMNAIQNFIISNDTMNSIHFIGEFSKLMRKTLDNSSKPTIALEDEIDYLKSYISIENMRFDNRVDAQFLIAENVDTMAEIPTMLLQPFVENVFVHAFNSSSQNPKLTISFALETENILLCKIIDNGKGLSKKQNPLHKSKGILLAKERLSLLHEDIENAISVEENIPNGTIVLVSLSI